MSSCWSDLFLFGHPVAFNARPRSTPRSSRLARARTCVTVVEEGSFAGCWSNTVSVLRGGSNRSLGRSVRAKKSSGTTLLLEDSAGRACAKKENTLCPYFPCVSTEPFFWCSLCRVCFGSSFFGSGAHLDLVDHLLAVLRAMEPMDFEEGRRVFWFPCKVLGLWPRRLVLVLFLKTYYSEQGRVFRGRPSLLKVGGHYY